MPRASVVLGVAGLVSLVILLAVSPSLWAYALVFERGAVYTVMLGELAFGVAAVRQARTAPAVS